MAEAFAATTGAPDWAQTGILGAFATALYWQERKDRRQSEERERLALTQSSDKLLDGLATLKDAIALIRDDRPKRTTR